MRTHVIAVPVDKIILVDGEPLRFDYQAQENLHALQWHEGKGELEWKDYSPNTPISGEADYSQHVAPFVQAFEAEKARLQAEAERAEAERLALYNSEPETRKRKEAELTEAFSTAQQKAHLTSSVGFEIDANETANRNVAGLVTLLSASGAPAYVEFCDYHNEMHRVTLADLKTMQQEIIAYGSQLYAKKWALRDRIASAKTSEELNAIEIVF